jgi:hypothetical protein
MALSCYTSYKETGPSVHFILTTIRQFTTSLDCCYLDISITYIQSLEQFPEQSNPFLASPLVHSPKHPSTKQKSGGPRISLVSQNTQTEHQGTRFQASNARRPKGAQHHPVWLWYIRWGRRRRRGMLMYGLYDSGREEPYH